MPVLIPEIPYIDPTVEHVGVSRLRKLNASNLRANDKTLVIQDNETPVAVLLAYEKFLCMQREMEALLQTLEVFSDEEERRLLISGYKSSLVGQTNSIDAIRRSLADEDEGD